MKYQLPLHMLLKPLNKVSAAIAYVTQRCTHDFSRICTGSYRVQTFLFCKCKLDLVRISDGFKVILQLLLHMLLKALNKAPDMIACAAGQGGFSTGQVRQDGSSCELLGWQHAAQSLHHMEGQACQLAAGPCQSGKGCSPMAEQGSCKRLAAVEGVCYLPAGAQAAPLQCSR